MAPWALDGGGSLWAPPCGSSSALPRPASVVAVFTTSPNFTLVTWVHGRAQRAVEVFRELLGVGDRADDPEAGGAVGIRDEALVGALGRADRAPNLCEGNRERPGSLWGPEAARPPRVQQQSSEPPPGSRSPGGQEGQPSAPERNSGLVCPPPQHPLPQLSPTVLLSVPGISARFHQNRGFGPQTILKTSE